MTTLENTEETRPFGADSYTIEKNFREKRKITTPIFGQLTKSTKGKPAIDALRAVLQHWNSPKSIPENVLSRANVSNWRYRIRKYLAGDNKAICERLRPLLEEYKDVINTDTKRTKSTLDMDDFEKVLKFWNNWQESGVEKNKTLYYKKRIRLYLREHRGLLPAYAELVDKYRDTFVIKTRVPKTVDKKVEEVKKTRKYTKKAQKETYATVPVVANQSVPSMINYKNQKTQELAVNFIASLKELGVTEFTVRF